MSQDRFKGKRIDPGTAARLHEQGEAERSAPGSAYRIQGGTAARKAESAPRAVRSPLPYEIRLSGRVGRPFTFSIGTGPGERLPSEEAVTPASVSGPIPKSGFEAQSCLSPEMSISRGPLNLPATSPMTYLSTALTAPLAAQPPTNKTLDAVSAARGFLSSSLAGLQTIFRRKG